VPDGVLAAAAHIAIAIVALAPARAFAQDAGTQDRGTDTAAVPPMDADALIRHGVELRRQGDDEAALVEFRRANEMTPTPRAVVQIAMAEQALGHWLDADSHLREGLRATSDPWIQANLSALQAPLEVIGRHLGSLDVSANVEGAELWINDRRTATLPLAAPLRLVTGTTVVELRLAGYQTTRRSVEIDPGGLARESFTLVAVRAAEPDPLPIRITDPRPPVQTQTPSLVGPAMLLGLSAVSFGSAGLFWALRANSIRNCEPDPGNPDRLICATPADVLEAAQGRTFTALTNVALITGALSAAASAVWLIVRNSRGQSVAPPARTSVWLVPSHGGMVFGVEGHL
jgi:hypothetical protein